MSVWPKAPLTPAPVVISDQLRQLCEWIDSQFSVPRGGTTQQLSTVAKLWQFIYDSGDQPTVLVCAHGEKLLRFGAQQSSDRTCRVARKFTVAILFGHGFRAPLQDETGVPPGVEMLTDSIEALRDTVRALSGISEEFPLHYEGWDPLPPIARPNMGNVFVDGAVLEFAAANNISEVSGQYIQT